MCRSLGGAKGERSVQVPGPAVYRSSGGPHVGPTAICVVLEEHRQALLLARHPATRRTAIPRYGPSLTRLTEDQVDHRQDGLVTRVAVAQNVGRDHVLDVVRIEGRRNQIDGYRVAERLSRSCWMRHPRAPS